MLREIDELTRELKRPIERTRRTIHIKLNSQLQKVFQSFLIDLFPPSILCEKQTEGKCVGHLRVVHFHVWSNLTRRRFWIISSETVDHVIRLRSIGDDALSIEKIAPFHDYLRDTTVVRKRPVMKERIEQQGHHPRRGRSRKRSFIRIVKLPILPQRSVGGSTIRRLLLVFVISVNTLSRLGPILLVAGHFPAVHHPE